jgi:tetratricopeptide (TPR) repeat protein
MRKPSKAVSHRKNSYDRRAAVNLVFKKVGGSVSVGPITIGPDFNKQEIENSLLAQEGRRQENDHWQAISNELIERIVFIDETYCEMKLKVEEVVSYIGREIWHARARKIEGYKKSSMLSRADVTSILKKHLQQKSHEQQAIEAARAAFYLAEFYEANANSVDADRYYSLSVELTPENLIYRVYAGEAALSHGLFERAEAFFAGAIDLLNHRTDEGTRFKVLNGYGGSLFHQNRFEEAEVQYLDVLSDIQVLGKEDTQAAAALNNFGWIQFKLGDVDDGIALLLQSIEMKDRIGDNAASRAVTHCNLASVYMNADLFGNACINLDRAELVVRQEYSRVYPNHPVLARIHNQRGVLYLSDKRFDLAAEEFGKSISILENQYGAYNWQTIIALHNQFMSCEHGSRYRKSKEIAEKTRERLRQAIVPAEIRTGFEEDYNQIFGRSAISRLFLRMSAKIPRSKRNTALMRMFNKPASVVKASRANSSTH